MDIVNAQFYTVYLLTPAYVQSKSIGSTLYILAEKEKREGKIRWYTMYGRCIKISQEPMLLIGVYYMEH